jgi:hypothetical protein
MDMKKKGAYETMERATSPPKGLTEFMKKRERGYSIERISSSSIGSI